MSPSSSMPCPPNSRYPILPGVRSRIIETPRLRTHCYESGNPQDPCLVVIHGNASSARFYEEFMARMTGWHVLAPDLRGYGASEAKPVDATRGLRDFADDIAALLDTLLIQRHILIGWSLGGVIAMQYTIDHPDRVRALILESSGSPFGYGGTHGDAGIPNFADFAGSGGGLIASQVIERYVAKDTTADSPFSPRSVMRQNYVKPPFQFDPEREDIFIEQMLMMVIGDQFYPGDGIDSPNWPYRTPGVWGANNALSPKYTNLAHLADIAPQPPILWIHGADDTIVSDAALVDPCTLGKMGFIPGWPGDAMCPSQPMLAQLRSVLTRYAANGGVFREEIFADCGHSPHLEHLAAYLRMLHEFTANADIL